VRTWQNTGNNSVRKSACDWLETTRYFCYRAVNLSSTNTNDVQLFTNVVAGYTVITAVVLSSYKSYWPVTQRLSTSHSDDAEPVHNAQPSRSVLPMVLGQLIVTSRKLVDKVKWPCSVNYRYKIIPLSKALCQTLFVGQNTSHFRECSVLICKTGEQRAWGAFDRGYT